MSETDRKDFSVAAGETFLPKIRWGSDVIKGVPITAITKSAPVVVTAVGHAVPAGWPVAVVSAVGMTEINSTRYPPRGNDWHPATVKTADTIELNDINSADFTTYVSGGFLVYNVPVDLAGMTASMVIRDAPDTGAILVTLTHLTGIDLDNVNKIITPRLQTAGLTWTVGYYSLELTDLAGTVVEVLNGTIVIN